MEDGVAEAVHSPDKNSSEDNQHPLPEAVDISKENEASEVENKNDDPLFASGENEATDDQPLGWDAGTERVKGMGWGDLPPASNESTANCDNGVASWEHTVEQANSKTVEQTNSTRQKSGRKGTGRRAKYTDVTDQLGFSTFRASTWGNSGHQNSRNSSIAASFPHRNVAPPPHSTGHSRIFSRNTSFGAANMSPGVLGQTASPQQQSLHSNAYSYAGQSHPRPQNMYGSYQQQQQQCNSSCNGYGSNTVLANSVIRSRGASNSVTRNNNDSPQADAPLSSTNVYIRGLDSSTTDDDLRKKCEKYGAILSTKAIMDKTTGQCKGYGFVDFESADAALAAVEGLNQEGKIQAQMAKQQEQDPTNLYFANLPPKFTENDLEKALNHYGEVISTRILKDQDGVSRGVGFARMDSKELCDRIIKEMNGKTILNGTTQPLLVKFADSGKKPKSRAAPVQTMYHNVPQMDLSPYFTGQYEQLNGGYIRSAPVPYVIPAPSQYVMNPHYPHVISGYPDPQMSGIASQLHNLTFHGTNAAVSQQPGDMNGSVGNAAVSAGQSSGGSAVQPMTMHPSYTYPIYSYPVQYGMQGGEPNLAAMTLMQSATPPTAYMPSNDMLVHPELPSNAMYTNQPPPTLQSQAPTATAPSK